MSAGSRMLANPTRPTATCPAYSAMSSIATGSPARRGLPHVETGHRGLVAAGELEHRRRPPRGHPLAAQGTERGARRGRLPVTPLPARGEGPVGVDLEVADLGAEAVGAAQHPAPR